MGTLTRVMARSVYGLDMTDLPLERLTEQKRKRRPQVPHERKIFSKASFSRWSRMEKASAPNQMVSTVNDPNAIVSPQVLNPRKLSHEERRRPLSVNLPKHAKVVSTTNSAFLPSNTPAVDSLSPIRTIASSPSTFTAG